MSGLDPLTPSQTRAALEDLDHQPKRHLGQNFLIDANIVRKSIALAGPQPGEAVLEIGPGLGTLTRALLQCGVRLYAIEQDPVLCRHLENSLGSTPDFHLLEGDACREPLAGYRPSAAEPYLIVANLPYAISSPWMEAVLEQPVLPRGIVILVQKEMADRMTATTGSKAVGALTIFLEGCYERIPGHRVARNCFFPAPKVDSVLFNLRLKPEPRRYLPETRKAVRDIFTQRRKQIGALIRQYLPDPVGTAWRESLSSTKHRPEELSFQDWFALDQAFRNHIGSPDST